MFDTEISAAWRTAAVELSIRVVAPYTVALTDGSCVDVEAFLPDFAAPQGALAVGMSDESRGRILTSAKLWVSQLGTGYRNFDRELFEDTLEDWGWYGPDDKRPPWYTGKYYGGRKTQLPSQ